MPQTAAYPPIFDGTGKPRASYQLPMIGNDDNRPVRALQYLVAPDGSRADRKSVV